MSGQRRVLPHHFRMTSKLALRDRARALTPEELTEIPWMGLLTPAERAHAQAALAGVNAGVVGLLLEVLRIVLLLTIQWKISLLTIRNLVPHIILILPLFNLFKKTERNILV